MSTDRAVGSRRRVAALTAAFLVALNSVVTLIGWAAGWSVFLTPSPRFLPTGPTTALAFLGLSIALAARLLAPRRSAGGSAGAVLSWIVASVAVVNLIVPSFLDQLLGGGAAQFGPVQLGVMSPVTAAA